MFAQLNSIFVSTLGNLGGELNSMMMELCREVDFLLEAVNEF